MAIDHAAKWRVTMLTSAASLAVGLIYHIQREGQPLGARERNKTSSNTGDRVCVIDNGKSRCTDGGHNLK